MNGLHFSLKRSPFRDNSERASFEYWTKAFEITTRQWCPLFRDGNSAVTNWAQLHLSFTTNYPHNGHFLWMKGQAGLGGGVGGGLRVGVGGENRTWGWQCCSECVSFFGVEQEGTAEGQSKGLCVRHFECRLCYTVHGSPRVQRERVIYFVDIMNVGFVFRSSRTRMFSLISPHRGWEVGFYFGHMETMGLITL